MVGAILIHNYVSISDTEFSVEQVLSLESLHASFQEERTNSYNNLDEIPTLPREVEIFQIRVILPDIVFP
jgi:hypothetical protein